MRVVWTRPARNHLLGILDYIGKDSPAAAYRVGEAIQKRVSALSDNPMIGRRGRDPKTRELILSGLPYIVAYRVTDRVEILAVMHGAQEWPERF